MDKEIKTFTDFEIEKKKKKKKERKNYRNKILFFSKDIHIEKVLVSKKIYFGEKNYKINTSLVTCINDHKVIS